MQLPRLASLQTYRVANGFPWFTSAWDLNVVVIRSEVVGRWDDRLVACGVDEFGESFLYAYRVTSEAWEGEWLAPSHPSGCIYIVDQHAKAAFSPGLHRGRRAMLQAAPLEYVRWPVARRRVPSVAELEELPSRFKGQQGTHIHDRVSEGQPSKPSRDDSEGCVVFQRRPDRDHFLALVTLQDKWVGGAKVSVTFVRRSRIAVA